MSLTSRSKYCQCDKGLEVHKILKVPEKVKKFPKVFTIVWCRNVSVTGHQQEGQRQGQCLLLALAGNASGSNSMEFSPTCKTHQSCSCKIFFFSQCNRPSVILEHFAEQDQQKSVNYNRMITLKQHFLFRQNTI